MMMVACPRCTGHGVLWDDMGARCPICHGEGRVAPRDGDPRAAFARLREATDGIRGRHREASWISAGMSGDLEQAVAEGATHLRVGTAILGTRPPLG